MGKIVRAASRDGLILASAIVSTDITERARQIHDMSPTATAALGRALSITSMMGASLKVDGGSITVQIKGDGPGGTIIAVADNEGNARGYVQNPQADVPLKENGKLDVGAYVGQNGYITVIKDLNLREPYIGTVSLLGGEIAEDIAAYYAESEQVPTVCAAGVLVDTDRTVKCSGAYLIQLMPGYDESTIDKLEASVYGAKSVTKMLDDGMDARDMLDTILSGFDIHILEELNVEYRCYCSRDRVARALISTGEEELRQMIEEQGGAEVTCQFCDEIYRFSKEDLEGIIKSMKS